MSVIFILLAILFILILVFGDEKGLKSFYSLVINFIILYFLFQQISECKFPITLTLISCGVMSTITLIALNGVNVKTVTALISTGIVILIMVLFLWAFSPFLHIQGFDLQEFESIDYLSTHINLSFRNIIVCEMLIAVFSAITDTAITISSSMNEIFRLNPHISNSELKKSGVNIGSDILGTTVNTLFFVYFGNMLILLIWFSLRNMSLEYIINSKLLTEIIYEIIVSGISVILVIPITTVVTAKILCKKVPPKSKNIT